MATTTETLKLLLQAQVQGVKQLDAAVGKLGELNDLAQATKNSINVLSFQTLVSEITNISRAVFELGSLGRQTQLLSQSFEHLCICNHL